MTARRK